MKHIYYIGLLVVASLFFTSCEGPMGPQGPQGPAGESTQWEIINLAAEANGWQRMSQEDGTNAFYMASFDIPELTPFIYDSGLVQCYLEYDQGSSNASQQLLPQVRHYEQVDGENYYLWTETVDYDYMVGNVNIYVTYSDFPDETIAPGAMNFRLVLMW